MMSSANGAGTPLQPGVSRKGGIRFTPGPFQYNGRVALALLPCLAMLAGFGGTAVASILLVGGAAIYILDALRYKEGAFGAAWLTLGIANSGLLFDALLLGWQHSLMLSALGFLVDALALALTGLWATLQFRFLQLQYPAVVLAFEKLLLTGCIPVSAAVITWGLAEGVGMSNAPYFLAAVLCGGYYLFGRPLPSSFQSQRDTALGGTSRQASCVQDRSDGALAFLLVVCLPAGVYCATHLAVLLQWFHLWSLLLLGAGPLLFVTCLPDGLWWVGSGRSVDALRRLLLLSSLAVFLAGLEGRVVFYSLGQYIHLAPPWNYLAATLVLYGLAALVLLHFSGALGHETESMLLGPLLMISAALGSLATGVPIWALPAPLLAAAGLSMFYDTRTLRDYLLFVIGGLLTGLWFIYHHFFFLDIQLGHMHLRTLCGLIAAAFVPAALLPGMVHARVHTKFVGPLLVVQAMLVCVLEEQLYGGDHEDITHNVHTMYPAYVVGVTSAVGLLVGHKLWEAGLVSEVTSYLLTCIYCAKLTMLVLPEAELTIPALLLLLATTPPLLLTGRARPGQPARPSPSSPPRLRPGLALASVALVVLAVIAARFAVFDVARSLLDRRPSEALVAGLLVLCMAAGCLPLVSRYYSQSVAAKRGLMLAAAFGLLLILLRPPLPIKGGAECPQLPFGFCPRLWNEEHTPDHEEDDVAIYGSGLRRREHWPLWFLVFAVFFGLAALTSRVAAHRLAGARLAQAAVSAGLVGAYLALDFFPGMRMLQVCVVASALVVAAFMVLLQVPGQSSAVLLPLLALTWAATFPLAVVAQVASALPPLPAEAERLFPDGFREVDEERREAVRSAVLAVFAGEALLLAFALKLRVSGAVSGALGPRHRVPSGALGLGVDASYIGKAAGFLGQCMPLYALQPGTGKAVLQGSGGAAVQRLNNEGLAWVPTCGNLVTTAAFVLGVVLNFGFTGGDDAGILVLAPLLLLLNQDPILLSALTEARRYFPPVFAASSYLVLSLLYQLVWVYFFGDITLAALDAGTVWYITKNLLCLAACLPSQWELLRHLWGGRRAAGGAGIASPAAVGVAAVTSSHVALVLALAPLNLLAFFLADLGGLRVLAGLGLVGAAVQLVSMRSTRISGMKVI